MGPWLPLLAALAGQGRVAGGRRGERGLGAVGGGSALNCPPLWQNRLILKRSEFIRDAREGCAGLHGSHLPSLSHVFPPHLQELLEYMRKLEARLEKVADEKWNEDPATEDEEAAAGLRLYTPRPGTPLPCSPSLCWESST